ncbi:MAG: sialidase family protein, partial [Candidatus Omnitrophica bacterium]|nr:sialidase family protein [Candidatus Omnitrophota bacterium]
MKTSNYRKLRMLVVILVALFTGIAVGDSPAKADLIVGSDVVIADIGSDALHDNAKASSDKNGHVTVTFGKYSPSSGVQVKNIYSRTSTDGGASWLELNQLTSGMTQNQNAAMGRDKDGHLYVAWVQSLVVLFRRSDDNGLTWSPAMAVHNVTSMGDGINPYSSPQLCNDDYGDVFVLWEKWGTHELMLSYSTDYGKTWKDAVAVGSADEIKNPILTCTGLCKLSLLGETTNSEGHYVSALPIILDRPPIMTLGKVYSKVYTYPNITYRVAQVYLTIKDPNGDKIRVGKNCDWTYSYLYKIPDQYASQSPGNYAFFAISYGKSGSDEITIWAED